MRNFRLLAATLTASVLLLSFIVGLMWVTAKALGQLSPPRDRVECQSVQQ